MELFSSKWRWVRGWVFPASIVLCMQQVSWAKELPVLQGIDIYGTDRFTSDAVEKEFGDKIRLYAYEVAREAGSKKKKKVAPDIKLKVEEIIRRTWNFASVRLSWMDYYKKDGKTSYVTVDVVEPQDVKKRMPFRPAPKVAFQDPSGLLADWTSYTETGWALVRNGDLSPDRVPCPAFYCTWGDSTPDLKELQDKFIQAVPPNKDILKQILTEDQDPVHRANAAYLLSFIRSGAELSHNLLPLLTDPDIDVRGAALRIYDDLAVYHKDVYLPMDQIASLLDYPTVEDRNRALVIMVALADQPAYREFLIKTAGPMLLRLLALKQPANHDVAYTVLGILSKENIDANDTGAWWKWLEQAQADQVQKAASSPAKGKP